ncbi:MAG: DNA polymerase III subunit alpha, partial [Gemmatimonadota bacterium]
DHYIRRKRGQEEVSYPHPDLEEILEPTFGIIVYQEQVMRTAQELAGYSLGEADVLRKAVGKKKQELIEKELGKFTERAVERGVEERTAREIAEMIETFGRYGFNKSHSAAYAVLSFRTAWLKAHYPAEFMAALLSSEIGNTDKVVSYIGEARRLDLDVLPPNVNESNYRFTVVDDDRIRFGLGAIKRVGSSAIASIIEARREDGPFESLFDLCMRIDLQKNNKRVLEALIAAGALDELGERAAMTEGLDAVLSEAQRRKRDEEMGQGSLFGEENGDGPGRPDPELPDVEEWSESERLQKEKELIGFYTSGHPLDKHEDLVRLYALDVNTSNFVEHRGRTVEVACVVTEADERTSRRDGREWGLLTLEDYHGTATAMAFGDTWEEHREVLTRDRPVLVKGEISDRSRDEDDPPIFVDSARPLSRVRTSGRVGVCIELRPDDDLPPDAFDRAREAAEEAAGDGPLYVDWRGNGDGTSRFASESLGVEPDEGLLSELRGLFGTDRVHLVREG